MSYTIEKRILRLRSDPELSHDIMEHLRSQLSKIEQPGPWDGHPFPGITLSFKAGSIVLNNVKNIHAVSYEHLDVTDNTKEDIIITYYVYDAS